MSKAHEATREIYHQIHSRYLNDDNGKSMQRLRDMYTEEYFGLGKDWFKGKKCLDAGCGDMIILALKLAEFGASEVTAMDLGTNWFANAEREIAKAGTVGKKVKVISGNALNIPIKEDASFDFVACNGVLCHVESREEVEKGFSECARLTKQGGYFYASFAVDGGLLEDAIFPALQKYYYQNADFKDFIDNINPSKFQKAFQVIKDGMKKYYNEDIKVEEKTLGTLFDEEYCASIQNYIQGPNRFDLKCSREFVTGLFEKYGFEKVEERKRFVKRYNIRRFLSPLQYEMNSELAKLLWGNGYVEYIGIKI